MAATPFLHNRYWILRHGKSIPNERGLIVSSLENGTRSEFELAPEGVTQAELAANLLLTELKENSVPLESVRICYSPFARTSHTAKVAASVLNIAFEGSQCKVIEDLRERYFGPSFELLSHDKVSESSSRFLSKARIELIEIKCISKGNQFVLAVALDYLYMQCLNALKQYAEIWALDEKDPFLPPEGGESVDDVACRLARAVAVIESEYQGCYILVVSHGDPLQILQTILKAASETKVLELDPTQLESRLTAARTSSILSQHRKFALLTGELRAVI